MKNLCIVVLFILSMSASALASFAPGPGTPGPGYPGYRPGPQCYPQPNDPYFWDQIARIENDMLHWDRSYYSAPAGSPQEHYADQRRRDAGDAFLRTLQTHQIEKFQFPDLESIALTLDSKYAATRSGSYLESVYDTARRAVFSAYIQSTTDAISCLGNYFEAEQWGLELNRRYNSSPSRSVKEQAYDQLRRRAFDHAVVLFQYTLSRMYYQDVQRAFYDYDQRYRSAPARSVLEAYFRQMRDAAERELRGRR